MKLGIVGLPNVGKSTLFNAITNAGAQSANYPFCTIEPNVGMVSVPDERLDKLAEMYHPDKFTPATIEFVDIAGLVKGASKGEGLGNKFLSHIREVDAIIHVVRCFENDDITHVDGSVDPARDIETINLELILSDLDILNRRIDSRKKAMKGDKTLAPEVAFLERLAAEMEEGKTARSVEISEDEQEYLKEVSLLTIKPVIYACNMGEDDFNAGIESNPFYKAVEEIAAAEGAETLPICAEMEAEIAQLDEDEKAMFLSDMGLEKSGLDRLIKKSYSLLGLISYLTTYAKISDYGFIEAPYRKVEHITNPDGTVSHHVTDEVVYMTADTEDHYIVAQANEPLDGNNCFVNQKVTGREKTEFVEVDPAMIDYMDVAPKMLVSVASAMIPFLENDDNTRALMGSNMQKQAVPLMVSDSPIVGTGMEYKAALDSGVVVTAQRAGTVERVQADEIRIVTDSGMKDIYPLIKFKRTNQGTCYNQRPIVRKGERVEEGQVIADGPATYHGEVSLGKNALIGFMTWEGYNYEDAVLLNEKLVRDDVYTSLHIEEYTHEARETKLGPEEITREIPNVGEDALKDLNAEGIVKRGTEVRSGDILVGKITPKGETELTAEERLLRAIFGEKSREVRDTSLRLAHGESGIVVDVRVFSQEAGDELPAGVKKVVKVYIAQKRKISVGDKMAGRHGNKGVVSRILPPEDMPFLPDGTPLDIVLNPLGVPSRMNIGQVLEVHLGIAAKKLGWKIMTPVFDGAHEKDILECLKMAGLQRDIFPLENPEGKALFEATVNEETGEESLRELTPEDRENAELIDRLRAEKRLKILDGKTVLYDGRTGEPFDNPVTVGIMYYLKLHHLVDDKIHARSNGPYSLVTQQPLGGKAQFGGQRFGEMEVWALEAYGAAYTLQELLTVKSDDINGRRRAYEAIIKGQNIPTPGIPESFKVLVKELQSLALDVRVQDKNGNEIDLSELCVEDDPYPISRVDASAIAEALNKSGDEDELEDSNQILDEDGNPIEDDETEEDDELFGKEEDDAYGTEFFDDGDGDGADE